MTQERDTPAPQVSGSDKTSEPDRIVPTPLRSEARPLPAPDRPRTIPILRLGPEDALAPDTDAEPDADSDKTPDPELGAKPDAAASEGARTEQEPDGRARMAESFTTPSSSSQSEDPVTEETAGQLDARNTAELSTGGEMRLTEPVESPDTDEIDRQTADAREQGAHTVNQTDTPDGPDSEGSITSSKTPDSAEDHSSDTLPKEADEPVDEMQPDADQPVDRVQHETAPPPAEAQDEVDPTHSPDAGDSDAGVPESAKVTTDPEPQENPAPQGTQPDPWAVQPTAAMAESPLVPEVVPERTPETRPPTRSGLAPHIMTPARERPACEAALFGKLPSRGDFIARSMPRLLQRPFEDWLIPLVQQTRTDLGGQWNSVWRGAGPWRFWIGPDVLGGSWQRDLRKAAHEINSAGGAVTGVLLPSADRHGRDFPLVLVLADGLARLMPPPVTTPPDRAWYDMCDDLLYSARAETEISAVERALDRLQGPFLPDGAEAMDALLGQRALWAQGTETRPDGTSQIWHDIAQADHHLAASQRSYWWQAPKAGSAQRVLSLAGLPDAGTFAFMLSQGHPGMSGPAP